MKHILQLTCLLILFVLNIAMGQSARTLNQGAIYFEKKIDQYELMKETIGDKGFSIDDFKSYIKTHSQFQVMNFKLHFTPDNSLFVPDSLPNKENVVSWATSGNVVYTDFKNGNFTSKKNIFNDVYLVKDSMKDIKWTLTDETQLIAGYLCKRANAIVQDSIHVIAFYTAYIQPVGGPELFHGLEGMILSVSIPQEHVIWFATAIKTADVPEFTYKIPTIGKKVNLDQLNKEVSLTTLNWGPVTKSIILKNVQL